MAYSSPAGATPNEGRFGTLRPRVRRSAPGRPRVDAEDLAEQRVQRLAASKGVAAAAAVPEADVEQTVGAEGELAAVVVGVGVLDPHELPQRARVGLAASHGQLDDAAVFGGVG